MDIGYLFIFRKAGEMRNLLSFIFLAMFGLGCQTLAVKEIENATAEARHSIDQGDKTDANVVIEKLIQGNDEFVKGHDDDYFTNIKNTQHPFLTMVCCSDSRVHTSEFSFDPVDKIFSIRVIGNQFIVGEGSVDYGVHHLHTPVLLILGHTHCGAIKAAMANYGSESTYIINELDHLHTPISLDDHNGDFESRWLKNIERNVDYQVNLAVHAYSALVKSGELSVVGAVYDFISAYGKGDGRMVITNINGEKDIEAIKKLPIFSNISDDLKGVSIARASR